MMEVPCAPPCPPGPTSLPLSAPPKPSATQDFQDLIELSPDSGNGEDLDEFDPLKSPVKVADVKCEGEGPSSGATEADTLLLTPAGAGDHREFCSAGSYGLSDKENSDNQTKLASVYYNGLLADANVDVTGKPGLFHLNTEKDRWANTTPEMQITPQSDSGSNEEPPIQDSQYSTVFNFGPLESSLLESCNPSFQCGPFSTSCGPVSRLGRCYETNGPFSLPAGGDPVLDAGTYNAPYLLGAGGSTTIRPFSMAPGTENVRGYHGSVRAIVPLVQPPSRPTRNPSYPRSLRGRPTRRYTSHDVVRKQPTAGGLLTTSCDLITSPPGQCACVNPGNSHACAIRASGNSPLGVLNPLFEPETSSTQVTYTSMPLSPRKFSLDQGLASTGFQRPELTRAPVPRKSFSACYQEPLNITSSLPCNKRGVFSHSCGTTQFLPAATSCSEYLPSQCQCHDHQKKPSVIAAPDQRTHNGDILCKDAHLDMECKAKLQNLKSSQNYVKPPLVTSPDWFSFLTPSQNSYTQRLFTPDDLQEELLYPAPYGLKSEIYQNLNAREADFVLQKPNRKPRTEPLPPSCLPVTSVPRPESPEATEGIIPPLATEDEEAQIEGALESRKVSLKDRRKPSLEKIYIPKPVETTDSVLNVKIDNFDRDEYVKFKKNFGETDPEIEICLEATKKDSCSSISSQSAIKTPDPHVIKASAINGREKTEKAAPCLSSHPKKETSNTNNPDAKVPDDIQQGRQRSSTFTRDVPTTSQSGDSHLNGVGKQASLRLCGKYSDIPFLKEMRSDNTRSRVPTMPKQRSLEEVEQRTAYADKMARKQSLPTEELFGLRRPRSTRKMSLSPLIDCHFHNSHVCGSAAFSPVCEVDEISSKYIEDSSKRKTTGKMHMYDADSKKKVMHNHRDVGHKGNVKDKKNHVKCAKSSFSSLSRSSAKVEEKSGSHHHRRPPEGTEHKHRTRSSTAGEGETRHKSGAQRSPRKARRHMAESHTNRRAPLSPPRPRTTADLFTKHEYSPEDRLTEQRGPTVPYEPLVDVITPTTPDTPMAASGATRKKQHSRSQSHPHPHHHHHHEDDGDCNVLSFSSISSSLSKSLSSSSSSTLTSSGSSRKGSSSSSSSSLSSGSDSTSSSSSESSSSSSSSDSSDFEDMIL